MVFRNPLTTARLISTIMMLESLVLFPVFFASWLACSVYQAVIAGWYMSKSDAQDKRSKLEAMIKR